MDILLDTTVLIDFSRGNIAAANYIEEMKNVSLFISNITAMELLVGCRDKKEIKQMEKLLKYFSIVHISSAISEQAYRLILTYSKSHHLAIPDALIAATAIIQKLELATDNIRDFRMIEGLIIKKPY